MSNNEWYSHQDWKQVIVKKSKATKKMEAKKNPKKQNAPGTKKFQELDGNEIVKPKMIDKNIAKQLQQARSVKKLKQKEVAQRLNVPVSMIQNIENGKAKLNKAFVNKLKKFYGIV
jgi:ribosome-binding protein aMBF1 (putative translation factor)